MQWTIVLSHQVLLWFVSYLKQSQNLENAESLESWMPLSAVDTSPLLLLLLLSHFSRVRLCVTPSTAAHQAPPSLGFSRQEHWSVLPFPSPMHEREKWKWSRSVVSDSSRLHGLQPTRLLVHGIFQARLLEWVAIAFSNIPSSIDKSYGLPR